MKKILTMFGVMLIMLFVLTINVHAYTYGIRLTPAKTMLKAGDTVTVDIMVSSLALETGEAGIIGLEAELDYDSTVFSKASVSGNGQWSEGENITKVKGIFFSNEVKELGKLATITLTVADSAKLGETTVTLKNIKTANGTAGEVTASNAVANFTIVEVVDNGNTDNGNTDNDNDNQNNNNDTNNDQNNSNNNNDNNANNNASNNNQNNTNNNNNNNVNNNTNKNTTTNTNKDNTVANKVISAAGLESVSTLVVASIIAVAGISYISYKKYKNM